MEIQDYPTIQKNQLCLKCQAINLDDLFDIKRLGEGELGHCRVKKENVFVVDLESSGAALRSSVCLLCKLFGSMVSWGPRPRFQNSASNITCHIHVHIGLRYLPTKARDAFNPQVPRRLWSAQEDPDQAFTFVSVGEVYIGPDEKDVLEYGMYSLETGRGLQFLSLSSPRQRQANAIDSISIRRGQYNVGFVKQCMTRCRNGHDHQCNNLSIKSVPFLRLIDCQSRKVITAPPNSEYTALSYVWGVQVQAGDPEVSQNQPLLDPHKCPKAINDSVQVTLDLNIKYLWIDKYCIDQFDDQDKAIQIGQMDSIYANAAVTIIAAAGDGPHHGLPGVDGTLRNMQPALKIGDHLIASILRPGADVVSKSKWATRGWTYQEGILSKRRLIFTNEQVQWECNNTHCAETIDYKPDRVNSTRKLSKGVFLVKTPETEPAEFFSYIAEFRKRTLTYQSDSLNALSGIFRAFEKGESPIYQLAGVPIFYPMRLSSDEKTITPKTVNQGFLIGLTWQNRPCECERVPMFPSWSWAGWTGPVHRQSAVHWRQQFLDDFRVWIETGNGGLHSFPESQFMKCFLSQLPSNIRYIQIEAKTFTCSIRYGLLEEEQKRPTGVPKILFQVSENSSFRFLLRDADLGGGLPQELPPWPKHLIGILIGDTSGNSFEFAAIIVKEHDGFYERIACTRFWDLTYVEDEMGLRALYKGGMEMFSNWIRNDTVRRTIRLG